MQDHAGTDARGEPRQHPHADWPNGPPHKLDRSKIWQNWGYDSHGGGLVV